MKKKITEESNLGVVIDLPLEEFKERIIKENVPVGILLNLRLLFTSSFNELANRQKAIMKKIEDGEITKDEETLTLIKGLYNEMLKIEQKAIFLTSRIEELLKMDSDNE